MRAMLSMVSKFQSALDDLAAKKNTSPIVISTLDDDNDVDGTVDALSAVSVTENSSAKGTS